MATFSKLSRCLVALGATAVILAGCSTGQTETNSQPADDAPPQTENTTQSPTESESPTDTELKTPEPDLIDTHAVGEPVQLPSADFTVRTIEERDMIPSAFPESTPDFEADDGERLWFFDIEWTNNTLEAVEKECHGPYMFELQVYDIDGAEMLMVDQPGMIEGQNCATGLQQGETGTWYTAFYGSEADFGWAVFTDYAGENAVVTLDPELELVRNP